MQKSVTTITAISTVIFALATVMTLKMELQYFFIFPLMTLLSLIVMLSVNLSKFRISGSELRDEVNDTLKQHYANMTVKNRVIAVAVHAATFLVASVSMIIVDQLSGVSPVNYFFLMILFPGFALTPILRVFFHRPLKYLAFLAIYAPWALALILTTSKFDVNHDTSLPVFLFSFFLLIITDVLAKLTTKKVTGIKLPSI